VEIAAGLVDGLELHGLEERGPVFYFLIAAGFDSLEKSIDADGWGILRVFGFYLRVRTNGWVF
jgi:hypothetical protein